MMKKLSILALAAMLLTAGCNKENPFDVKVNSEEGQILKAAIAVDLKVNETVRQKMPTRADVSADDFTLVFTEVGKSVPSATYKYAEMPDVVTLPTGDYVCTATYGEDRTAEWESPYYKGVSESFTINPYEITSYISPIECRLENIKVTIDFDLTLRSCMSSDSYVEVKVKNSGSGLKFTTAEADAEKAGYFKQVEETTLVATFTGTIDGVDITEAKALTNVSKGNHYKITFKKHADGGTTSGDTDADVEIDASVVVVDVECNVTRDEDELLDDSERPTEGDDNPGEDPDQPKLPTIVGEGAVNIDAVNEGLDECVVNITSYAEGGIQELYCDIESPTLTPEELAQVGLASHLDLAHTPEGLQEPLEGLGFPINVAGQSVVVFKITDFLPMLAALGDGEHHFVITVSDANGTTVKTLKIKI